MQYKLGAFLANHRFLYLSLVKSICIFFLTWLTFLLSCRKDHEPPILVGQEYGGGIVFYVDATGHHGWIAAKEDLPMARWGISDSIAPQIIHYAATNATSTIDGFANTAKIIAVYGDTIYAAKSCHDYEGGGFHDWYLPAKDQLDSLYFRNITNLTILGMRHNYMYWSSTEYSAFDAWFQDFGTGYQFNRTPSGVYWPDKTGNAFIRPIRSF